MSANTTWAQKLPALQRWQLQCPYPAPVTIAAADPMRPPFCVLPIRRFSGWVFLSIIA